MPNIAWKWQAKDAEGKIVEAAPGQPYFYCRGPATAAEMIRGANLLLNNKRLDAVRFGLPDPGYVLDKSSLRAVEEPVTDLSAEPLPIGEAGKAAGADLKPLDLPTDAAVNAAHAKFIEENGG